MTNQCQQANAQRAVNSESVYRAGTRGAIKQHLQIRLDKIQKNTCSSLQTWVPDLFIFIVEMTSNNASI